MHEQQSPSTRAAKPAKASKTRRNECGGAKSGDQREGKKWRGEKNQRRGRKPRPFTPEQLAKRAMALPLISYPDLPVSYRREEIAEAIRDHQVVIVSGETGSGKTTQLPKICLQLGRGVAGMIGHTQPRRLAARTVAERIAEELGQQVGNQPGQVVGYQVRFTDQVGPTTLVKLMTDGILLNEIGFDPTLSRYDTIIVDEAHERSLNIDFILGYLTRLLPQRPDLKVVITSATIDSGKFAEHFAQALGLEVPVIEVSGRTYPVEVRYRPLAPDLPEQGAKEPEAPPADNLATTTDSLSFLGYGLGESIDVEQAICAASLELLQDTDGDILVFLPGERDIHEVNQSLTPFLEEHWAPAASPRGVEIVPLFSRLSAAEQHRIFEPHQRRRIVLATNIAETSLTVPGIRSVIDPGLARISRFSNKTKVQRLPIEPVSQASSNQRAGRAGRVAPGVAIRLFSERDFAGRDQFTEPEILRTSLASVILQMAALKLGEVARFPFIDPPTTRAIRDGITQLVEIQALTKAGEITDLGWRLSRLSVDPRLGRMLLEGLKRGYGTEMAVIVGALSIQDVRERPLEHQQAADEMHARFADPDSDFVTYLNLWRYLQMQSRELSGSAFRRMCRREFLHYLRFREWRDVVAQLRAMCADLGYQVESLALPPVVLVEKLRREGARNPETSAVLEFGASACSVSPDEIHRSVLVGLLANVGNWDETRRVFAGTRGTHFTIWPGSTLAKRHTRWVMAAELVETSKVFARTVAMIQPEWVEAAAQHLLRRTYAEPYWSKTKGAAFIRERVMLYGLTLAADRPRLLSSLRDLVVEKPASAAAGRWLGGKVAPDSSGITAAELARDMFICHALVLGEWRIPQVAAKFVEHNQQVLAKIEALADKQRNPQLVPDEDTLCAFYARRVPESVNSAHSFERWWRNTRLQQPHLLDFQVQDLVPDEALDDPRLFPPMWLQGDLRLEVTYSFSPGQAEDGMSVRVPLGLLSRVKDTGFDWLAPGMLPDLCEGVIRALPKEQRRKLAPASTTGERISEMLAPLHPQGDAALSDAAQADSGQAGSGQADSGSAANSGLGAKPVGVAPEITDSPANSAASEPAEPVVTALADTPQAPASSADFEGDAALAASLARLQNWGVSRGVVSKTSAKNAAKNTAQSSAPASSAVSPTEPAAMPASSVKAAKTAKTQPIKPARPAQTSFAAAFADTCYRLQGVTLSEAEVQTALKKLPSHLQMNFAITDKRGAILGAGGNLTHLQQKFSTQADRALNQMVQGALQQVLAEQKSAAKGSQQTSSFADFEQDELTELPAHPLPERLTIRRGGLEIHGYPTLVAQGRTVNMRVLGNRDEARAQHRLGLAALLFSRLELSEQRVVTRWTGREALLLAASPYPNTSALVADAQLAAAIDLVDELTQDPVRDKQAFDQLQQAARPLFEDRVYGLLTGTVKALEAAAHADTLVSCILNQTTADPDLLLVARQCRQHCKSLLYPGFLVDTPSRWVPHLARYLQADELRLQKAARGSRELDRDFANQDALAEVADAYQAASEAAQARPFSWRTSLRLQQIKWQLEELRVSLFAEQLGTSLKVSPTRLLREINVIERD